jgi:hypothetical protein
MRYIALLLPFLVGCSTVVPVVSSFPEVPKELLENCPQLQKLEDNAKLSDVAKTVSGNYMEYHKCSSKAEAWAEWYKAQKQIHEEIK